MKIIELVDVNHAYADRVVLKKISISFPENKLTAIIGKSGSGKSTLLQSVNGLIKPTSGTVNVFGENFNYKQFTAIRLRIGYMVQGTGLFPHLTVTENISIADKLITHSISKVDRIKQLMDLVGLPESFQKKYPHELSGGEQQRVGICRALFLNPSILLMDEPLGSLDPITRYEIQKEILTLQQIEPRTILLVTHDMREASKLADYILVLDKGEIQQFDAAEKILKSPANKTVEELINATLA